MNNGKDRFIIFNLDDSVKMQLIAYAKLYHNDKIADVIKRGMELIKREDRKIRDGMDNRMTILEERVAKLEKEAYHETG